MELNVSQVKENNQYYVKIERSQNFDDFVWQELLKTIKQFQDTPFKEEKKLSITAEWVAFLSILQDLQKLRDLNKFHLICTKDAENKIQETIENQKKLISKEFNVKLDDKEIEKLKSYGFSKINLTKFKKEI